MENTKVRVSIGNLVWHAVNTATGEVRNLALLNMKKLAKGKRMWAPLGGGVMLTEVGKAYLEDHHGATSFEVDKDTGYFDARFLVDRSQVEQVFFRFNAFSNDLEHDVSLDILHEIEELKLFSVSERASMGLSYSVTVEQAVAAVGTDTSGRAQEVPTHRLFRIHSLRMPGPAFEKLFQQNYVRSLADHEIATTEDGLCAGNTTDGDSIQNNIF